MSFLEKIFGENEPEKKYEPKITLEKIQHIFEYGKLTNLTGLGDESLSKLKVGHLMNWRAEEYFYTGYKDIPAQTVPPYIGWSKNPVFAYVSIVDQKVQYHWSEDGGSAVFICPVTTNSDQIKHIDKIFEHYYLEVFKLPHSLNDIKISKESKADKTKKMKFLEEYLTTQNKDFFEANFFDDDIYDIAMWVDWREEDENIINYCADILQTEHLSVKTLDADNERGFETIITYKNQETLISYTGLGSDRDTTIRTLNQTIQPTFEIRLCKESLGGDTLCFVPLTKEQWLKLEKKYPNETDEKFKKITTETTMFN